MAKMDAKFTVTCYVQKGKIMSHEHKMEILKFLAPQSVFETHQA